MKVYLVVAAVDKFESFISSKRQPNLECTCTNNFSDLYSGLQSHSIECNKVFIQCKLLKDAPGSFEQLCELINSHMDITYILVDSNKLFATEYGLQLSTCRNVVYYTEKLNMANLIDLLLGKQEDKVPQQIRKGKAQSVMGALFKRLGASKASVADDSPLLTVAKPNDTAPQKNPEKSTNNPFEEINSLIEDRSEQVTITEPNSIKELEDEPDEPLVISTVVSKGHSKARKIDISDLTRRSEIICVSGDRRCGKTTIATYLAHSFCDMGLYTLVVDLDVRRRGTVLSLPVLGNKDSKEMTTSLINAVRTPYNIKEVALNVEEGLDLLNVGLEETDITTYEEMITNEKIQSLLMSAVSQYDRIIVDVQMQDLNKYNCLTMLSRSIIFPVICDAQSVLNTINLIDPDSFDDISFYQLFISKIELVLNQYCKFKLFDNTLTEENFLAVMDKLIDSDVFCSFPVAGRIEKIAVVPHTISKEFSAAVQQIAYKLCGV